MRKKHLSNPKDEVRQFLKGLGVLEVGVADPERGFDKALEGCHPKDTMREARSTIVFALNIGLDYYTAVDYAGQNIRVGHLYRDWVCSRLVCFLRGKGWDAMEVPRGYIDPKNRIAHLSFKLAAYEAGLGVYGKSSLLLVPELGPRVNLGVVLTDAALEPDVKMKGFEPCENCRACAEICPVRAIEPNLPPPTGFDRARCVRFINWIREATDREVMLCGYCYDRCPAGQLVERTLSIARWRTLLEMPEEEREQLLGEFRE